MSETNDVTAPGELAPPDYCNPVIEVYKKRVDQALLRENLKLTVEERLLQAQRSQEAMEGSGTHMSRSPLQESFVREVAATFLATKSRIVRRLAEASPAEADSIIEDELWGLCHGLFVIFDGGSALANEGLVRIEDEDGWPFDRFLHEFCFNYWPAKGEQH